MNFEFILPQALVNDQQKFRVDNMIFLKKHSAGNYEELNVLP